MTVEEGRAIDFSIDFMFRPLFLILLNSPDKLIKKAVYIEN